MNWRHCEMSWGLDGAMVNVVHAKDRSTICRKLTCFVRGKETDGVEPELVRGLMVGRQTQGVGSGRSREARCVGGG